MDRDQYMALLNNEIKNFKLLLAKVIFSGEKKSTRFFQICYCFISIKFYMLYIKVPWNVLRSKVNQSRVFRANPVIGALER